MTTAAHKKLRDEIARHTQEFLAKGHTIKEYPSNILKTACIKSERVQIVYSDKARERVGGKHGR